MNRLCRPKGTKVVTRCVYLRNHVQLGKFGKIYWMGGSIKTRFTYINLLLFLIIVIDTIVEIGNIIEQLKTYFGQNIHVGTIFHIIS